MYYFFKRKNFENRFFESRLDVAKDEFIRYNNGEFDEELFEKLKSIDPTPPKKYILFIIKVYFEDGEFVKTSELEKYSKLEKEINSKEPNFNLFDKNMNYAKFKEVLSRYLTNEDKEVMMRNEAVVLKENEYFKLVAPLTHRSSYYYGTIDLRREGWINREVWCTSYNSPKHWNNHSYYAIELKNMDLIILKVKNEDLVPPLLRAVFFFVVKIPMIGFYLEYMRKHLNDLIRRYREGEDLRDMFGERIRFHEGATADDFFVKYEGYYYIIEGYDLNNDFVPWVEVEKHYGKLGLKRGDLIFKKLLKYEKKEEINYKGDWI